MTRIERLDRTLAQMRKNGASKLAMTLMRRISGVKEPTEFDRSRGIIGYLPDIEPCQTCSRLTNLKWDTDVGEVTACTKECAEIYAEEMS